MRRGLAIRSDGALDSQGHVPESKKKNEPSAKWLFLLSAWACYFKWLTSSPAQHIQVAPVIEHSAVTSPAQIKVTKADIKTAVRSAPLPEKPIQLPGDPTGPSALLKASESPTEHHQLMLGSTMALSGKCTSPDYGTRFFFIKSKHTMIELAGIFRRIGALHSMVALDPPDNENSFKDEMHFHRVAQGRCFDFLVAQTKRGPWLDKAFKGAMKFSAIRDPVQRAVSAFQHSKECGAKCAMCYKLLKDQLKWAKGCTEIHNAQYEFIRGVLEDPAAVIDSYDFVLIAERPWESLVVLRYLIVLK